MNKNTQAYTIDNSEGQLFGVLSELYSRPVDSCIREVCTNCNDAHIMSGKEDTPFIITLPNLDEKIPELSIRDFGPGLEEDEIMKIFTYGASSKRDDIDATGCLGLGAKSPYAITDTFYIKSYNNRKVYQYICFKDEKGTPNFTKIETILDTLEENGLEIIIPIWNKYDYIEILKRELKFFKIKPLVFMAGIEGKIPIEIIWEEDKRIPLTDKLYISKFIFDNFQMFCAGNLKVTQSIVEQLQIWYPIDTSTILETLERYNTKRLYPDGSINTNYKISDNILKLIQLLLNSGIKIVATGEVMFSPSREYIKYTERTLDFLTRELIKGARTLEKILFSNFQNVNSKESYFENYILQNSLYRTISENFNLNTDQKLKKYKEELEFNSGLFGVLGNKYDGVSYGFEIPFYKKICNAKETMVFKNVGYRYFDTIHTRDSGIYMEYQTKEYQETNIKVLKDILRNLIRGSVKKLINDFYEDTKVKSIMELSSKYNMNIDGFIRGKASTLKYLKTIGIFPLMYKILEDLDNAKELMLPNVLRKGSFLIELFDSLYRGYINLSKGLTFENNFRDTQLNIILDYYKLLHKIAVKKNVEPIDYSKNIPLILKNHDLGDVTHINYLEKFNSSVRIPFKYSVRNIHNQLSYPNIAVHLWVNATLNYNPYYKDQLELQQMDLTNYNINLVSSLDLPSVISNRFNCENQFYTHKKREKSLEEKIPLNWDIIDLDVQKIKDIILNINTKIDYLLKLFYLKNRTKILNMEQYVLEKIEKFNYHMEIPIEWLNYLKGSIEIEKEALKKIFIYIRKRLAILEDLPREIYSSFELVLDKNFITWSNKQYFALYLLQDYIHFIPQNIIETIEFDGVQFAAVERTAFDKIYKQNFIDSGIFEQYYIKLNNIDISGISYSSDFLFFKDQLLSFGCIKNLVNDIQMGINFVSTSSLKTIKEIEESILLLSNRYRLFGFKTKSKTSNKEDYVLEKYKDFNLKIGFNSKSVNNSDITDEFNSIKKILKDQVLIIPNPDGAITKFLPKNITHPREYIFENYFKIKEYQYNTNLVYSKLVKGSNIFGIIERYSGEYINHYGLYPNLNRDISFSFANNSNNFKIFISILNSLLFLKKGLSKKMTDNILEINYSGLEGEDIKIYEKIKKKLELDLKNIAKEILKFHGKLNPELVENIKGMLDTDFSKIESVHELVRLSSEIPEEIFTDAAYSIYSLNEISNSFNKNYVLFYEFPHNSKENLFNLELPLKVRKNINDYCSKTFTDHDVLYKFDIYKLGYYSGITIDDSDFSKFKLTQDKYFSTEGKFLQEDIFKSQNKNKNLFKNIKNILSRNPSAYEQIQKLLYIKSGQYIENIPDFFKQKYWYLNLNKSEMKKYILQQKINKRTANAKNAKVK